jgi:hypothetical protein
MDIVDAMWLGVVAYLGIQLYTLLRWRGGWRIVASVPLLVMVPVVGLTIHAFIQQSNIWPIILLFAGPAALLFLLVLMVAHTLAIRRVQSRPARQ